MKHEVESMKRRYERALVTSLGKHFQCPVCLKTIRKVFKAQGFCLLIVSNRCKDKYWDQVISVHR